MDRLKWQEKRKFFLQAIEEIEQTVQANKGKWKKTLNCFKILRT